MLFSVKFGREFPRAAVVHHFYLKSRVLSKVVRGRYNCHQNKNLSSKGRAISQCSPFPSLPQRCSVNFFDLYFYFQCCAGERRGKLIPVKTHATRLSRLHRFKPIGVKYASSYPLISKCLTWLFGKDLFKRVRLFIRGEKKQGFSLTWYKVKERTKCQG